MQLLPQDCQARLQCAACQKNFTKTEWTPNQLKHANRVCKTCMANGYTTYNPQYYTCRTCGKRKGCKHFDRHGLKRHELHGSTKLECLQCCTESATREKTLHAKFKQSKQYCKCGNPIHSEKCPLATMFYDKRRWPGGDGYITAQDSVFFYRVYIRDHNGGHMHCANQPSQDNTSEAQSKWIIQSWFPAMRWHAVRADEQARQPSYTI